MSRFLSECFDTIDPYVPGEQPQDKTYVKLNTNESPFAPSPNVVEALNKEQIENLNLYSDPEAKPLVSAVKNAYNAYLEKYNKTPWLKDGNVFVGNGSDEVLAFAFRAFSNENKGMACPEIGYGFYPVFCKLMRIPFVPIEINDDFSIDKKRFQGLKENITIANPNAQTGLYMQLDDIKSIVCENKDRIVIIDEAYCDFGGKSAVELLDESDNLIIVGTLSKSRQLAGGRVGFAIAHEGVIEDLNKMKFSFNPYNINRLSIIAGSEALNDTEYFEKTRRAVMDNRTALSVALNMMRFEVTDSRANFVLAKHAGISGKEMYEELKKRGVLVRFLSDEKLKNHVRITVGSEEQIAALLAAVKDILKEKGIYDTSCFHSA